MEREANVEVLDFDKSQNIEVLVQEEVQLDINVPLFYIKSGEEDIKAYVTNHAKPELDAHTTSAVDKINQAEASSIADMEIAKNIQVAAVNQAGQIAAENVAGDAIEIVDNHANSVIIPQLQEFTAEAQTQATNAATSASSALASKTSAESYATQAEADRAAAEQAATSAVEAKDLANEAVTKLNEFDTTVNNAKTEITSLSSTEQSVIASAASSAKDVAVSEINSAKDTAVDEVEQAGTTISSFQFPIVPISQGSGNVSVETNTIYQMTISDSAVFVLPTDVNTGVFNQIKVMAQIIGTPTIDWGTSCFINKTTPEIEEGYYDVYFDYDNLLNTWVCGVISKGV